MMKPERFDELMEFINVEQGVPLFPVRELRRGTHRQGYELARIVWHRWPEENMRGRCYCGAQYPEVDGAVPKRMPFAATVFCDRAPVPTEEEIDRLNRALSGRRPSS